jgi:hypothetical protein
VRNCAVARCLSAVVVTAVFAGTAANRADAVSLSLVNPGFEAGDLTGWTTYNSVPQWGGGSNPSVVARWGSPWNEYHAVTWLGSIQVNTGGVSGFSQSGISMPADEDVRWSFWLNPNYSTYQFDAAPHAAVTVADNMGHQVAWDIFPEWVGDNVQFHFADTLPTGWSMSPASGYGYDVTTDNLKALFPDATTLTVAFTSGIEASEYNLNDVILEVDDRGPTPEPSTLIVWSLLGICGLGYGWWRRRRAA